MMGPDKHDRVWWMTVGAIALAGLALRILAARGGLWTDEAWSVIYAAKAHDALGVFLHINHDNNHHLYSLWLQGIGPAAPPLLARAPAIVAGSLCVVVAAALVRRRSRAAGIVAALLFAVSPALVALGSEARGYSMMLLASLTMLLLVSHAVDERPVRGSSWWLALVALLGMLSHMTMAAPVAVATLWFYLERRSKHGPAAALRSVGQLMIPALVATASVVIFVFTAAALSPTGMRLGGYEPFSARGYSGALDSIAIWSAGLSAPWPWAVPLALGAVALLVGVRPPYWLGPAARLYALLILAVPVAAAVIQPGNTQFARYYLASAVGVLLLFSEWIGRGLINRPTVRASAALLVVALVGISLYRDSILISVDRGRPAAPLADIAALSPNGARIAFAEPRLKAVIAVAAEQTGYPARFAGGCTSADFLLAKRPRSGIGVPTHVEHCGVSMDAIDSAATVPITGDSWILYRAKSLQSFGAADSGRAPAAVNRRISSRAGVAQG